MVNREPTTNQRENFDKFTAPNNNIIQCFFGQLGGLLPRSKERGTLDISREERSNKCFRIDGSKVCIFTFFLFASQSSISTHSYQQYRCLFIFGKNGMYSKQTYDCFEQGNMGLFIEKRDQNYFRILPRVTKCGSRYSMQDSEGCR